MYGRVGQETAGRAANAMISDIRGSGGYEYGSIQKVMPRSRDHGYGGVAADQHYSSRPTANQIYQSMQFEAQPDGAGADPSSEFRQNIAAREQQFIEEERNFAKENVGGDPEFAPLNLGGSGGYTPEQ